MQIISVHPENPQSRWVTQAAKVLSEGGVIVYPTDSGYSVGCDATNAKAVSKLYHLKKPIKKYLMSLMVADIPTITEYASISNEAFKLIKAKTPGPYTFILPANKQIARKLGVKRQEIGVRISAHPFLIELSKIFKNPILNTAARINEEDEYSHPDDIENAFLNKVDLIITAGEIQINPTNVISAVDGIEVLRGEI